MSNYNSERIRKTVSGSVCCVSVCVCEQSVGKLYI